MKEETIKKALKIKAEISKITDFIYAIDKDTVGTIGHTGKCKIKVTKKYSLWSMTNSRESEIVVPEEIVLEIGEIAKRERNKLQIEFDNL